MSSFLFACQFLISFWLSIVAGDQFQNHLSNPYESNSITGKNYVVISTQVLRPRSQFSISVHVFEGYAGFSKPDNRSFRFYSTISSMEKQLVSFKQTLFMNYPQMVYFQTPGSLSPNFYELHVKAVSNVDEFIIFDQKIKLEFENRFVCVVFQTTRPIYCAGQTVRFRILVLDMNLLPYNDVLDVFILDPDNIIIKRWLSVYTNNGVISLKFKLPKLTKNGIWKIKSKIDEQVDEKYIFVETYYKPFFEVFVSSPPYITESDIEITALTWGVFSTQKHVRGNATVSWFGRKLNENSNFTVIQKDIFFLKENKQELRLPVSCIETMFVDVANIEIKIFVTVTELMSGENVSGFSHTRIISSKINLKFLNQQPMVFTPGSFLHGHVVVSFEDGERIPTEILEKSSLKIQLVSDSAFAQKQHTEEIEVNNFQNQNMNPMFYDMLVENIVWKNFLQTSVHPFRFDISNEMSSAKIIATFTIEDGVSVSVENLVLKKLTENNEYVKVWTDTEAADLFVGDYAIFHVSSNFIMDILYVLVLSKGIILKVLEQEVPESTSLFTFSLPISSDMAPWFHLIVYTISRNGIIQSDAVLVPIDGFSRYQTTLQINTGKDFRNEQVELTFSGAEGAFIGVQATRSIVYHLQTDHEITRSRMINGFLPFEKNIKALSRMNWFTRTGENPKESIYYPTHGYAFDSQSSFSMNFLKVISNMDLPSVITSRKCEEIYLKKPCVTENCLYELASCNNHSTSKTNIVSHEETHEEYFVKRISWNSFIFDAEEGDWAFREIRKNDHVGIEFDVISTPSTADDWYFSTFTMDMVHGFSLVKRPVIFSSKRPLMAHILGPNFCHRGEQLGLKLNIHNFDVNQMFIVITLLASDDYKFVHVEKDGFVTSYNARLSSGDHQILIYMPPESENEIRFPVKPTIEQGLVEVQFYISSQIGRVVLSHIVNVLGEGASINRHTSVSLDLRSRGFVLQYLDLIVEESPIIPYEMLRRFVFGSPKAKMTISNSVIGPSVGEELLEVKKLLLRESKGALDSLFELHTNIWSLHYLRYTNQLDWRRLKETLYECNTLYAETMKYFHSDGWFSFWEVDVLTKDQPSVWLTAWALRIFKDTCYPDWEFQFWIDPSIFSKIFKWLLSHQKSDGRFVEIMHHQRYPFDNKFLDDNLGDKDIALTADVIISLFSAAQTVNNELKSTVIIACVKARIFLENALSLPTLRDPNLLSMIAYVLFLTGSSKQAIAFVLLQKQMRVDEDGLYYWSRIPISANPVKVENQKPYIRPRTYKDVDSSAVEATSWALLVHLAHDGVTPLVENIVQWLVSIKMTNNGFISLIDTAVAYQALTEFSYKSRILDMTNIIIKVELMMSKVTQYRFYLANASSPAVHLNICEVWGNVHLTGKGSGLAFIQMDVDYGVDNELFVDIPRLSTFELQIAEFYSYFRNKSMITVQSCFRYVGENNSTSGAAILELQLPTGYNILESDAVALVKSNAHPNLRDSRVVDGKIFWFFNYIDNELRCFNHSIKRWYPVANMTLYRNALLYEITARERFVQVLINSTPLYILSICEVCGSFQCPYCPYYNAAITSVINNQRFRLFYLICFVYVILINR